MQASGRTRITAAKANVLKPNRSIRTIYVDLGFGKTGGRSSCGIRVTDGAVRDGIETRTCRFADLSASIREHTVGHADALLVIEAPLSMRFDDPGNPCPREVDVRFRQAGDEGRFAWYRQGGLAMFTAARFLLRGLHNDGLPCRLHLAEGFVSGKASAAFVRARNQGMRIARREGVGTNRHVLDTIIIQQIHAGEYGFIDASGSAGLQGCDSILRDLTGQKTPPPVLCLLPPRNRQTLVAPRAA